MSHGYHWQELLLWISFRKSGIKQVVKPLSISITSSSGHLVMHQLNSVKGISSLFHSLLHECNKEPRKHLLCNNKSKAYFVKKDTSDSLLYCVGRSFYLKSILSWSSADADSQKDSDKKLLTWSSTPHFLLIHCCHRQTYLKVMQFKCKSMSNKSSFHMNSECDTFINKLYAQ